MLGVEVREATLGCSQVPTTLSTEHVLNLNSGGGLAVAHRYGDASIFQSSHQLCSVAMFDFLESCPLCNVGRRE